MPSQSNLTSTRAKRSKRVASANSLPSSPSSRMTQFQRDRLRVVFSTDENPSRETLEALSEEFNGFPVSKLERWFKDHGRQLGRARRSALQGRSRDVPSSPSTNSESSLEFTPESTLTELPSPNFTQARLPYLEAGVEDAVYALLLLHRPVFFR